VTAMRPYSGILAGCPKCQYPGITTIYHAAGSAEHLGRACAAEGGCGYTWVEACADDGEAPAGEGLRPYSGRNAACPKCEVHQVTTRYRNPDAPVTGGLGERLTRNCGSCGYEWAEACADAGAEVPR
jgi:hypothetical protein